MQNVSIVDMLDSKTYLCEIEKYFIFCPELLSMLSKFNLIAQITIICVFHHYVDAVRVGDERVEIAHNVAGIHLSHHTNFSHGLEISPQFTRVDLFDHK